MLAVIGGSGLSQLANLDVSHREVLRTPYGEPSGAVTFGQICGRPVAFLARQNALAIVFFAVLVGGISASGGQMQRRFDLPDAATQVLQGTIFLCVLASNAFYGRFKVFQEPELAG